MYFTLTGSPLLHCCPLSTNEDVRGWSLGGKFEHSCNKIINKFFPVGYYANEQVQGYILLPLIDLLMSTPASLAISKVSELELLTVLARHDHHKEG